MQTFPIRFDLGERFGGAAALRQRVVEAAIGHVLELGGDTGANLFFYPRAITSLTTIAGRRTSPALFRQAARQLPFPIDRRPGSLLELPLKDRAYDTVICTFSLGQSPDLATTLQEIHRVLKLGGRLLFVEYSYSRDEAVARWQRRLRFLQPLMGGGRKPLARVDESMVAAGLTLKHLSYEFLPRVPRPFGCVVEGIAFNESP
jgi:ubiquinone/menaquinone biosynthesis C-methylase UbiE